MIAVCDMGPLHYLVMFGCDAEKRSEEQRIETLWTLQLLDEPSERGLIQPVRKSSTGSPHVNKRADGQNLIGPQRLDFHSLTATVEMDSPSA